MKNIIFVDDEINVLNGFKRILHKYENEWAVKYFPDSNEALSELRKNKYDMIITDMKMPIMDGLELLKKAGEIDSGIYKIILSGQTDQDKYDECLKVADVYLSKPCEENILIEAIRNGIK